MHRSDCQTVLGGQNGGHGDVSCTEVIVRLCRVIRMVGMVMCHVQK